MKMNPRNKKALIFIVLAILGSGSIFASFYIVSKLKEVKKQRHNKPNKTSRNDVLAPHDILRKLKSLSDVDNYSKKLRNLKVSSEYKTASNSAKQASYENSLQSSEIATASNALSMASAISSASVSESRTKSYSTSASLQQSAIDSEDSMMASDLSLTSVSNANSYKSQSQASFANEVAHEIKTGTTSNPYTLANNHSLTDFGELYRSEAGSLMTYLGSVVPASSFNLMDKSLANVKQINSYNQALDNIYSAYSGADSSKNIFRHISYPLKNLGSIYNSKVDSADNYIISNLSGQELLHFRKLENFEMSNVKAHDSLVNSYLDSIEDKKAYKLISTEPYKNKALGANQESKSKQKLAQTIKHHKEQFMTLVKEKPNDVQQNLFKLLPKLENQATYDKKAQKSHEESLDSDFANELRSVADKSIKEAQNKNNNHSRKQEKYYNDKFKKELNDEANKFNHHKKND